MAATSQHRIDRVVGNPARIAALADFVRRPEDVVRRRVERFELVDRELVSSVTSLDVWIPSTQERQLAVDDGRGLIVLLGFAKKGQTLLQFDLSCEGKPASLLGIEENTAVSAAVLGCLLGPDAPLAQLELQAITGGPEGARPGPSSEVPAAIEAVRRLEEWATRRSDAEELMGWTRFFIDKYALYAVLPRTPDPGGAWIGRRVRMDLAGPGPPSSDSGVQRHVRYAEQRRLIPTLSHPIAPAPADTEDDDGDDAAARLAADTAGVPRPWLLLRVPAGNAWMALSYHASVVVPEDLRGARAWLSAATIRKDGELEDRDVVELMLHERVAKEHEVTVNVMVRPKRRVLYNDAFYATNAIAASSVVALAVTQFADGAPSGLTTAMLFPAATALAVQLRSPGNALTRTLVRPVQILLALQVALLLLAVVAVTAVATGPGRLEAKDVPLIKSLPDLPMLGWLGDVRVSAYALAAACLLHFVCRHRITELRDNAASDP